jgi:tetratricopeptide (TPR) repeat protein
VTAYALERIVQHLLEGLPADALPPDLLSKLRTPSIDAVNEAAEGLLATGHLNYAEALYRAILEGPSPPLRAKIGLARIAERTENWERALELWTECHGRDGDRPFIWLGRANALLRLWRPDEALAIWRAALERFPDREGVYVNVAAGAGELGLWNLVERCIGELIARFANNVKPEWLGTQVRCLQNQGREDDLTLVLAKLASQFPNSELHARLSIDHAIRRFSGANELYALTDAAYRKFPGDRAIQTEHVRNLLAAGQIDDAEKIVEQLESGGDDHQALISRWRVTIDRTGDLAIQPSALDAVSVRSWAFYPGLAIGGFLASMWHVWTTELALTLFDDLERRFPGRIGLVCAKVKALIALQRDEQALMAIDEVPAVYQTQDVLELRAWAAAKRGRMENAKAIWNTILSHSYFAALHCPEPNLELIRQPGGVETAGGIPVFLFVQNEINRLREFLAHYRKLGIRRFIIVDHMSTDGGFEYLSGQPDVILYRTSDHFRSASSGMRWKNTLIQRHGGGGWCLLADTDEAFIYPAWENTPIESFTRYLDDEGAEGVSAFMLDVYPERLFNAAGEAAGHDDYRYCDTDYVWLGQCRAPFAQPIGGIRFRLIGAQEYLLKVPLIKARCGVHLNSHETTPLKLSQVTGALLHYKLLSLTDAHLQSIREDRKIQIRTDIGPDSMRRYERYVRHFDAIRNSDLRRPDLSEMLTDSLTLADSGLIRAPPSFRHWLSLRT